MSLTPEQSHFLQNLRLHLIDLSRRLEPDVNEDVADYVFRLQQAYKDDSDANKTMESFIKAGSQCGFRCIQRNSTSLAQVTTILADAERNWQPIYPDVNNEGLVGRRKFEISRDQLQYLVDYDLKISDISEGLGVSRSTIKRRLREYGISISERKTVILDAELDFIYCKKYPARFSKCWI